MQVSALTAIFKADFGRFRPFFGLFRPYRPPADTTRYGRYGPILAESAQFSANRSRFGTNRAASARIEPHRRESSRVGANLRKKKKKKNVDAVRRAGNRVERRVPRRAASDVGAAPLVPRPCFLADESLGCTVKVWLFYLKRENSLILLLLLFRLHILSPLLVLSFLFSSLFLYFLKEFFKSEKCKNSHSPNEKNGWI